MRAMSSSSPTRRSRSSAIASRTITIRTYPVPVAWDLRVDFTRTDSDGLTHASMRNARPDITLQVGDHIVIGNEGADPAVARVVSIEPDGIVFIAERAAPLIERPSGQSLRPWRRSLPTVSP